MAGLTDLMKYNSPTVRTETRSVHNPFSTSGPAWSTQQRNVVDGPGGAIVPGLKKDPLEEMLEGYDEKSLAFEDKLKSIYDGYLGQVDKFGAELEPIFDQIEADIEGFEGFMGDYQGLVEGMEGDFLNSIMVDPNASRTKHEYMGNVASQYEQAEDAMRRQAIQQGQNPYANKGGQREMALNRAGDMAGAANQAYGDWRESYNRDIQRQQAANAAYADLYGKKGEMYGDLLGARGGLLNARTGVNDTRLQAQQARASGYEGLMGLNEQRRNQAIQLGQQQAAAAQTAASEANALKGSLPGQTWYNPNFNAGGSQSAS